MEEKGSNKDADGIQTFRAFGNEKMDHGAAMSQEQLLGGPKACGEEGFLDSLSYRRSEAMITSSLQPNVALGLSTAGASRDITNICNKKEDSYEDRPFTYRSEVFTQDTKDFGFLTSNMSGNTLKLRNDPQVLLGKQAEKYRQEVRQQQIQQWVLKHNFSQDSLPSDCWPDKYPQITAGCENENPETVEKLKSVKFAIAEENRWRESSSTHSLYNEGPKADFAKSSRKHVHFLSDNSIGDKSGTLHVSEGLCAKRRKLTDTNDEAVEGYSQLPLVIPEQHDLEENVEQDNGHCMSLRQWLNRPHRVVDCYECLHIFKQILEFVELAHTQGVALRNVRPSSFVLSSLHRVSFVDSASSRSSSGSSDATTGGASGHTSFLDTATQSEAVSVPTEGRAVFRSPSRTLHRLESAEVLPDADAYRRRSGIAQALTSSEKLEAFSDKDRPEFATWRSSGPSQRSSLDSQKSGSFGMRRIDDFGPAMSLSRGASGSKPLVSSPKFDVQENVTINSSQLLSNDRLEQDTRFPVRPTRLMEETWYASPEEILDGTCSYASDIYSLGVLFFELFSSFSSWEEYLRMMSDLRHRILPPRMLSERPKEAAFCLWLLHPDPNARPQPSEIMHSEILNEAGEALAERQTAMSIEEREEETQLLLDFLLRVQQQKQELAGRLKQDLSCLTSDIQEVKRRRSALKRHGTDKGVKEDQDIFSKVSNLETSRSICCLGASMHQNLDIGDEGENETPRQGSVDDTETKSDEANIIGGKHKQEELRSKCARLMSNFDQLEQVYFAMRWKVQPESCSNITHSESKCTSTATDVMHGDGFQVSNSLEQDYLGCFFDSLCKYGRYSRFEVKATLRHGDLMNTANMVCSLGFDRDQEYFATAGVCRRIKVFECDAVLNENVDIHFPVIEMVNKSMLSSICWNSYVKSHIASSDYEGVVQLWDASTGKSLMQYKEHEKRAWSVDFSQADPTKLASGSDDGRVKIWSINQEGSIGTIKTSANVCCIQFPRESAHLIAFGSADYKIYIYDLRNPRVPWFTLASHSKAVSYVKFLDASTLVSASTDNTLKLWDLSRTSSDGGICEKCLLTYTGHTNEKNFVGLSVMDGYIACGSETNSVFAYHKSLPMPMASHRFGCVDPVSGHDAEDDTAQFVSSVCWRGKSQTLVAANSKGNIKVLEMV